MFVVEIGEIQDDDLANTLTKKKGKAKNEGASNSIYLLQISLYSATIAYRREDGCETY
jgi:hypothetical protein